MSDPDHNRPDTRSADRFLKGRTTPLAPPDEPRPSRATPQARHRDSVTARAEHCYEVTVQVHGFDASTNLVTLSCNAWRPEPFKIHSHRLPPPIQWAVNMQRRFLRATANVKTPTDAVETFFVQMSDWRVDDQRNVKTR